MHLPAMVRASEKFHFQICTISLRELGAGVFGRFSNVDQLD